MLGYFLATLIGLSLGLLGGGGSILTVPILVYAMKMDAKLSIALSLAIVAVTSLIGVWGHYKNKNVDLKIAAVFAPVAMLGTFVGAKLSAFMSGQVQLILFAVIMLMASFFMLRPAKVKEEGQTEEEKKMKIPLIAVEGIVVGIVTGLVGVGGGFLIVPALVLLGGVDMKKAVGTSLLIISLKSFSGFAGYMTMIDIPWAFLGKFILFSGVGIIIGSSLVKYISQEKLKKAFALFLIVMGVFILYKNREKILSSNLAPVPEAVAAETTTAQKIYVDVREKNEIQEGRLEGALWLPLSKLEANPQEALKALKLKAGNKSLQVYCRSGNRSKKAVQILEDHGFEAKDAGGFKELANGSHGEKAPVSKEIPSCCG